MTLKIEKDENDMYSFTLILKEYNGNGTSIGQTKTLTVKDTEFNNVSLQEKYKRQNTFGFFSDHFGSEHGHTCDNYGKFDLDDIGFSFTRIQNNS